MNYLAGGTTAPNSSYRSTKPVAGSTTNEHPYRSRGEAQIGRLLDRYGIPFEYERPTRVNLPEGRVSLWRPDFTVFPETDEGQHGVDQAHSMIVEYAGMPDRHDYRLGMDYKQHVYGLNGYAALFALPQDLEGPAWPERLRERIDRLSDLVRHDAASARRQPALNRKA